MGVLVRSASHAAVLGTIRWPAGSVDRTRLRRLANRFPASDVPTAAGACAAVQAVRDPSRSCERSARRIRRIGDKPKMRPLGTSAAGFIGSTLVDRLLAEGHRNRQPEDGAFANLESAIRYNEKNPGPVYLP